MNWTRTITISLPIIALAFSVCVLAFVSLSNAYTRGFVACLGA